MLWITAIVRRDNFGKRGMRSKIGITLGYSRSYASLELHDKFVEVFIKIAVNFVKLQILYIGVTLLDRVSKFVDIQAHKHRWLIAAALRLI